jgi:hypothetical protein
MSPTNLALFGICNPEVQIKRICNPLYLFQRRQSGLCHKMESAVSIISLQVIVHYSLQGLNAGGAFIDFSGPKPSSFPVMPTMMWTKNATTFQLNKSMRKKISSQSMSNFNRRSSILTLANHHFSKLYL